MVHGRDCTRIRKVDALNESSGIYMKNVKIKNKTVSSLIYRMIIIV